MLSGELRAQIRHLFYAEHWTVGTIAQQLGVHPDTVRHALETEQFNRAKALRPLLTDPYVEFIRQTLQQYPRLRATRIYQMIRDRGYTGSVVQLRPGVTHAVKNEKERTREQTVLFAIVSYVWCRCRDALCATDMRKGFNGLYGLVRDRLQGEPLSGHVFLFCNARLCLPKISKCLSGCGLSLLHNSR
jgi:hypothetical protein